MNKNKIRLVFSVYPVNARSLNSFYEIEVKIDSSYITEKEIEKARKKVRLSASKNLNIDRDDIIVSFLVAIDHIIVD